jgi:hypothetical protein
VERLKDLGCLYIPINVKEELRNFYEICGFKKSKHIPMSMDLIDEH